MPSTEARWVAVAVGLARSLHAATAVIHIVDPGRAEDPEGPLLAAEILEERRPEGAGLLKRIVQQIEASSPMEFSSEDNPAEEILATARNWNADLIVIGFHGRRGFTRLVMGVLPRTSSGVHQSQS